MDIYNIGYDPDELTEVENPKYQTYEEICKDFFGKAVLITKINYNERERILGGVVTYYTLKNKGIYDKWGECMEGPDGDRCIVKALYPFDFYGRIL